MDNFEYSIQISDRDWEEFYSTAEECNLMQVSLATEEELLLSDTEQEDVTCSTASSKTKFIRVSLCPPVEDRREPQTTQVASSPPRHSAYKWISSSDDVLSGSEDEEEFGSVARFLCQKEALLSKKVETDHRTDIPSSKTKDDYVANSTIEKTQDSPVIESLVDFMRSLNTSREYHYESEEEDIHSKKLKTNSPNVTSNGESEKGHLNDTHNMSEATKDPSKSSAQLLYSKESSDILQDNETCIMVKGPSLPECLLNGNIPGITNTNEDTKISYSQSLTTLQASLGKYDQPTTENEIEDSINIDSSLHSVDGPVYTNTLLRVNVKENDIQDCTLQFTSKALEDSSAVQQNIPTPMVEILDLSKTKLNIQEPDTKVYVSSHELSLEQSRLPRAEGTIPVHGLVPATMSGHSVSNSSLPSPHQSSTCRSTVLTLPEMYDFFFDDVSECGIVETSTNKASQEAILECRLSRAGGTIPVYSLVPATLSGHSVPSSSLPGQHQSSYRNTVLSVPEMYDFFFDDVSESGIVETSTNKASQEAILECRLSRAGGTIPVYSLAPATSGHSVSSSSLPGQHQSPYKDTVLTFPEMYDFFFDDVSESGIVETATNMANQDPIQECTLPSAEGLIPVYGLVPATISGHAMSSHSLPTQHQSSPSGSSTLTLPEMYDFFFDDVSESGVVETATNMAGQEASQKATVYTHTDMYEYFFKEENENKIKIKDHKPEESSGNVEKTSSPPDNASWPEACEFFFADGPQERQGVLFSTPSSQTQRATNVFQSIFPKGLQEFTARRTFHGRDVNAIPHENRATLEEANVPGTGSLVPYLSPSRSDACLVFLALASWAVKSSDLQSSDGWKTALVANIGAVSAIRYLRRRRSTWQGPTLEPLEET